MFNSFSGRSVVMAVIAIALFSGCNKQDSKLEESVKQVKAPKAAVLDDVTVVRIKAHVNVAHNTAYKEFKGTEEAKKKIQEAVNKEYARFGVTGDMVGAYMDSLANANPEKFKALKKRISKRVEEISHDEMEEE